MFAPVHTNTTRGRWISRLRFRHWNAPSYNHGAVLPFPLTDSFCDASLPVYTPFSASFLVFRGRRLRNWMQQSSSGQQEVSVSCHIFVASFRRTLLRFPFNCFLDNISVERNIREESTCRSYSSGLSSIRAASCHSRHFGGCWQIEPDRAVVRYNTILNQALPWKVCLSGPHTGIQNILWSGSHCSQFCLFKYFKFLARKKLQKFPKFQAGSLVVQESPRENAEGGENGAPHSPRPPSHFRVFPWAYNKWACSQAIACMTCISAPGSARISKVA